MISCKCRRALVKKKISELKFRSFKESTATQNTKQAYVQISKVQLLKNRTKCQLGHWISRFLKRYANILKKN